MSHDGQFLSARSNNMSLVLDVWLHGKLGKVYETTTAGSEHDSEDGAIRVAGARTLRMRANVAFVVTRRLFLPRLSFHC